MKVVWSQNPEHLKLAGEVLGRPFIPEEVRWLSVVDAEGKFAGAVIYSRFTPWHCEVSAVVVNKHMCQRKVLFDLFAYPFQQLGYKRLNCVIALNNVKSLKSALKLGFTPEAQLRNWFGDTDGVMFRLLKEECKWLVEAN